MHISVPASAALASVAPPITTSPLLDIQSQKAALICYAKPEHGEPGADDSFPSTNGVRTNPMLHPLAITQD